MWLHGITALSLVLVAPNQPANHSSSGTYAAPLAESTDSTVYSGRKGQLEVPIPRLHAESMEIDGHLSEEVWLNAAILNDFTQYEPVEGIAATETTEVRIFYSSDAIYFGVRAYDSEPDLILAHMGERDRAVFSDDWFRILLDTFDDQRQAYVFYVNPLGLQTDGLWLEGMQRRPGMPVSIDYNPDFIWESGGRVTETGWEAEIKIPYASLRFRSADSQNWGIQLAREVRRKGFKQSWAPLTQNVSNTLAQSGRLVGLQDLRTRRLVEVNPVATGRRVGQAVNGVYEQNAFEPDFGINGRVGITQNLVFDGTVNPDFSQVEADANRITVNERFALFYPEKRPFFLEGTEIFRTPLNLVHTRQIADPVGGAKITGKVGSFNIGYLGAWDDAPKTIYGGTNAAAFNLVRVRRDVGSGSTVGVLYTDRSVLGTGQFNRVVAADARLLFSSRYSLTTQFANSWTSSGAGEPVNVAPLFSASIQRSGRTFQFQAKFDDIHHNFRSRSGFVPRVGDTEAFGRVQVATYGNPGALIEQFRIAVQGNVYHDHDEFWSGGKPFEGEIELHPALTLKGGRSLWFIFRSGYYRFRSEEYSEYTTVETNGDVTPMVLPNSLTNLLALGFIPRIRINNALQLNGRLYFREVPIYDEASRGLEFQAAPNVTLRPTSAAELSIEYTYSHLRRQRDQTVFSTAHIPRARLQYQFNRAFMLRGVVQYSLENRDALRDPTTENPLWISGIEQIAAESGRFEGQFLLKYEPSPGTVFFIGYNRLMRGLANLRLSGKELVGEGVFVKASYLFRR